MHTTEPLPLLEDQRLTAMGDVNDINTVRVCVNTTRYFLLTSRAEMPQ